MERNDWRWVFNSGTMELKRRGRGNGGVVHQFGGGEEEQAHGSDVSLWPGHGGVGQRGAARWRLATGGDFVNFVRRRKKPGWARWTAWAGWAGQAG
jgi:hypothetical protein